jgi:thiamine biosynthesis lipoprotein
VRAVESLRWRAMGTDVHVVVVGGPLGLAQQARTRLAELEARWSRFLPTSDIARCNARPGAPVAVHDETVALVQHAIDAWRRTDGRFDPTVHDALVAAGYDRTFTELSPRTDEHAPVAAPGCTGVVVDVALGTVTLPAGMRLDAGGIAKGLAADLLVDELCTHGAAGALVDIGGDLRVRGSAPDSHAWTVAVEHPLAPDRDLGVLGLASGHDAAVATSSTLGRRWRRGAGTVHHLVDPRTGRSHRTGVVAATVLGTRGWITDVATKVLVDGGPWPEALGPEPPSVVVHHDGRVEVRAGAGAYLHPPAGAPALEEVLSCSPR